MASVCNPKTHRFWEETNKTSALNFTPDSTLFPLQVYVPPSYIHGSHHCWLLFNLRGEEVMGGAEDYFRESQFLEHAEEFIHPSECLQSHLTPGADSFFSAQRNLAVATASSNLLSRVACLTPPHPSSCFVRFPSSLMPGLFAYCGKKRCSVSIHHPVVRSPR